MHKLIAIVPPPEVNGLKFKSHTCKYYCTGDSRTESFPVIVKGLPSVNKQKKRKHRKTTTTEPANTPGQRLRA